MIDETIYGELDRYFHSQMSAEEKRAFEVRLSASEELRSEYAWLNVMLGGMKQQGRMVMKQTVANAIAGVPVAKYKPSINGKSFLKKWWWAIASIAVAAAVVFGVYKYVNRHVDAEHHEGDSYQEMITIPDSTGADSCMEEAIPAEVADSLLKAIGPIEGEVQILYEGDSISRNKALAKSPKADSSKGYNWNAYVAQGGGAIQVQLPTQGSRLQNMKTSINKRSQPPYTYTLGENLILNANYTSTAGFQFQGSGDTVYMTDNAGLRFRLIPTATEKPLVPMSRDK